MNKPFWIFSIFVFKLTDRGTQWNRLDQFFSILALENLVDIVPYRIMHILLLSILILNDPNMINRTVLRMMVLTKKGNMLETHKFCDQRHESVHIFIFQFDKYLKSCFPGGRAF